MASVNKVILVGNLGRDPETRTFPSGDQVCNATLATTDKWKDKQSGEMREATEWHRLVFNGRLAEIAAQYLRKGSQIYVEGQIRTRKYTDKDGVEKYSTEIVGDRMQLIGGAREGGSSADAEFGTAGSGNSGGGQRRGGGGSSSGGGGGSAGAGGGVAGGGGRKTTDDFDDDIPF